MKHLKSLIRYIQKKSEFVCCLDTNFIEGIILKNIRNPKWFEWIQQDRRLLALNQANALLLINEINEYEIRTHLIKRFGFSIKESEKIFNTSIGFFNTIKQIPIKEIKITREF